MLFSQEYREIWNTKSKIAFRFVASYFLLYIILMFASGLFEKPFRWIGLHVLHLSYDFDVKGFGSGDHTYAYITLFINVTSAIIITALWSVLDRVRKSYNIFFYWFLVILRLFLIGFMLLYGFVKVFQIQFQSPALIKLLQPLGEFSPMGLAWTYMGYSKGFSLFAGLMEIIGGLLLIPKRTTTLGAFIIIGVMTQVAMMNLMFDIPVKLFSIHLILMAFVIFSTDIKRFTRVFIKNKPTKSNQYFYPNFSEKSHKNISRLKLFLVPILLIASCILGYLGELNVTDKNHRPHLYGIWEIETFVKNKDTIPPLLNKRNRWRYLVIERKGNAIVKTMDDELLRYNFVTDTLQRKISMSRINRDSNALNLNYDYLNTNYLHLKGVLESDSIDVHLFKKNLDDFPLKSRGFHWINERPYNL